MAEIDGFDVTISELLASYRQLQRPTENDDDFRTRLFLYALDAVRTDILAGLAELRASLLALSPAAPAAPDLAPYIDAIASLAPAPGPAHAATAEDLGEVAGRAAAAAMLPVAEQIQQLIGDVKTLGKGMSALAWSPSGTASPVTSIRDRNNPDNFLTIDNLGRLVVTSDTVAVNTDTRFDYGTRTDSNPVRVGKAIAGTQPSVASWTIQTFTYDTDSRPTLITTTTGAWS